jgi:hypothetical protein
VAAIAAGPSLTVTGEVPSQVTLSPTGYQNQIVVRFSPSSACPHLSSLPLGGGLLGRQEAGAAPSDGGTTGSGPKWSPSRGRRGRSLTALLLPRRAPARLQLARQDAATPASSGGTPASVVAAASKSRGYGWPPWRRRLLAVEGMR